MRAGCFALAAALSLAVALPVHAQQPQLAQQGRQPRPAPKPPPGPLYDNYGRPLDYGRSYDYPYQYSYVDDYYSQPRFVEPRGGLTLETVPDKAQVYVDGFYVGLAEDFGQRGRALDLAAGSHRVELRAPDYDMLSFSVMVEPNQIVQGAGRKFSSPLRPLCPLW